MICYASDFRKFFCKSRDKVVYHVVVGLNLLIDFDLKVR